MPEVKIYIRQDDIELWKAIEKKSAWVSEMLNSKPRSVKKSEKVSVDKRNADVTAICEAWEALLGQHDGSVTEQRRYASTLHKKYGDKVANAIKIVKLIRDSDEEIKPTFGSLKDVYYKWSKIEDFYNRNSKPEKKGIQY